MINGVLIIDKPAGMTSHDVVDTIRRRLGTRKVGHAGTLDPDATGVLVVGVGCVTRLLSFAGEGAKRYRATAIWGASTSTQDASGEIVERRSTEGIGPVEVEKALTALTGEIEQIPPMVSAVKVGGERLHAKARRGEEVERSPRRVTIFELRLREWRPGPPPEADLEVGCSAGTYVRTLVHELGEALGCGGHVGALRRVDSGGFTEAESISLEEVGPGALLPPIEAVRHLARISVDDEAARAVSHGGALPGVERAFREGEPVAVARDGELLAIYTQQGSRLVPQRVLAASS